MRVTACLGLAAGLLLALAVPSAAQSSLAADLAKDWASQRDTMMTIAAAMPEDQFGFKPTPAQRSYGEQILHVAGANVGLMGILGATVEAPKIDQKATSKAAILKALGDSFDYGSAVLKAMTDTGLHETVKGPSFFGDGTRARFAYRTMMHTEDIYGQMAVYLRLSGLVPPASQRP